MANSVYKNNYVGKGETFAFALSGGGQNFCYNLISTYLAYFYINVFHIDAKTVGLMFFIMGVWDIVNNPLVGVIVDKTRTKNGKMIPYLRWFTPPLALFTILLFSGPKILGDSSPYKVLFMVVTYLGWEFFYTLTDVPYWGLSSVITPNPDERTRILTVQNAVIVFMCGVVQVAGPIFLDFSLNYENFISLTDIFFYAGLIGGIIGIGLYSLSGWCVKERIEQSNETPSIKHSLSQLIKNPVLRIVIVSNLIYTLSGVGVFFSTYYFIDVLGLASFGSITLIPFGICNALSYGLVKPMKKRFNNKQLIIGTYMILGIVQLILYFIGNEFYDNYKVIVPLIMVYQATYGLLFAFLTVIPNEMFAEATDYAEWTTGKRNEGVSFSLKITTSKLNSTITQSLGAFLLSSIGYLTSEEGSRLVQTDSVKQNLWLMFYLVPAVIVILTAVPYFFYPLVGEKKQKMYEELKERREM